MSISAAGQMEVRDVVQSDSFRGVTWISAAPLSSQGLCISSFIPRCNSRLKACRSLVNVVVSLVSCTVLAQDLWFSLELWWDILLDVLLDSVEAAL